MVKMQKVVMAIVRGADGTFALLTLMLLSTLPEINFPLAIVRQVTLPSCLVRVWAHVLNSVFQTFEGERQDEHRKLQRG